MNNYCYQHIYDNYYSQLLPLFANSLKKEYGDCYSICTRSSNDAIGFFTFKSLILRSSIYISFKRFFSLRRYGFKFINGYKSKGLVFVLLSPIFYTMGFFYFINLLFTPKKNISKFSILDIKIGDLLIDSYIRFAPSASFIRYSFFNFVLLTYAINDIIRLRLFFKKKNISLYITSYSTYINHGVPVRVALKLGVKVISFGSIGEFGKVLTLEDPFHTVTRRNRDIDKVQYDNSRYVLSKRLKKIDYSDLPYMRKKRVASFVDNIDTLRDSFVIFMHDFTDSYHIYNHLLFDSFWDWAITTIKALQSTNSKFFIKPHPNQSQLSKKFFNDLLFIFPKVTILDSEVPTKVIAESKIKCGITVYGSIAYELAFFNIPTLVAGFSQPYEHFDFAFKPKSINEYLDFIKRPDLYQLYKKNSSFNNQSIKFHAVSNSFSNDQDRIIFLNMWEKLNYSDKSSSLLETSSLDEDLVKFSYSETWSNFTNRIKHNII